MRIVKAAIRLTSAAALLGLTACGGGGATRIASIPAAPTAPTAPAPTPPPTPPAPTPPPIPSGPIGLTGAGSFKTTAGWATAVGSPQAGLAAGNDVPQFSYSAATNTYTIALPEYQPGRLITKGLNGSYSGDRWQTINSSWNAVTAGDSEVLQPVSVNLDWAGSTTYKYTGTGSWSVSNPSYRTIGAFAYGIPTAAGDVPLTGSANYSGLVRGVTSDGLDVWGGVTLSFDFGAATLSGVMKPTVAPIWDEVSLSDYPFRDTVFQRGSTGFSGAFAVKGSSDASSFEGSFNGPQAAELMANWSAPYQNPQTNAWGRMVGVWTAKKP